MTRSGPWTRASLIVLLCCDLAVLVVVVLAWHHASFVATPQAQMIWLDLAGVGLLVGLGSHSGWLLAGRRTVGRRSRSVADRVLALPVREGRADLVLTGRGMSLFHRPGCALVSSRATRALPAVDALDHGLRPCAVCRP